MNENIEKTAEELKSSAKAQMELLTQRYEEMRQEFMKESKDKLKVLFKELFESSPGIKCAVWTQYTPYFNDGDTCEFSVNSITFSNSENGEDVTGWGEYDGSDESIWATDNFEYVLNSEHEWNQKTKAKILEGGEINYELADYISGLLQSGAMEDVMQAMFGDHVKILATVNGFDIEDYDHD